MVSALVGCLILGQAKVADFGVIVREVDWRAKPTSAVITELEKIGNFKVKIDCELPGTITLLMQNAPVLVILDTAIWQQNLLAEKQDGVIHIVRLPISANDEGTIQAPFQEATISSGMKLLAPKLGIKYRLETKYCNEKVFRVSHQKTLPKNLFIGLLKGCGATYEIEKGVYVIKDNYWSLPKSAG